MSNKNPQERALMWCLGDFLFDDASGRLYHGEEAIQLDRNSSALLAAMVRQPGEPLSKDELLAAGWPGRIVHENSLAKAIGRLRQALREEGQRIEAVYGSGYQLTGPVERSARPQGGGFTNPVATLLPRPLSKRFSPAVLMSGAVAGVGVLISVGALWWGFSERRAAQQQEEEVETLLSFLSSDLLGDADPYAANYQDESRRQLVERTAETMDERLEGQPGKRAILHRMIGQTFSGWGEYEKAISHFDRAHMLNARLYGSMARQNIPIDIGLCQNLRLAGETRRAERICLRAEQVAYKRNSALLGAARIGRAKLQFEVGAYPQAASALGTLLKEPRKLSKGERADALWFHALSLRKLGHFEAANAAFQDHLEMRLTHWGARHPLTGWAHADYGDFLVDAGNYAKADRQLSAAQSILDEVLGADHPEALSPAYSRAVASLWQGRPDTARAVLRPMLTRYRETLGSDHFWTLYVMSELALAEAQMKNSHAAEALLREARRVGTRVLYDRDSKAAYFHLRWARALASLGKVEEAINERRRALLAMDRSRLHPDHPWRARLHCTTALIESARGSNASAQQGWHRCLEGLEKARGLPPTYPPLVEARRFSARRASLLPGRTD